MGRILGMTITTPFSLGDIVMLTFINRPGIINGIRIDNLGIQYRVCYWFDGCRKSEWVYDSEIVKAG